MIKFIPKGEFMAGILNIQINSLMRSKEANFSKIEYYIKKKELD